jgi:hypothetical protein
LLINIARFCFGANMSTTSEQDHRHGRKQ